MKKTLEAHDLCKLFPMMTDTDYQSLVESIKTGGFDPNNPIITHEGKVLDGMNRYTACRQLKVEPVFIEYDGDDALGFVASRNLSRRHLTPSQAAAVGAEIAERMKISAEDAGKKGGRGRDKIGCANLQTLSTNEKAAKMVGASPRNVAAAMEVKKEDPKEFEEVKKGKTTVNAALQKVHAKKDAAKKQSEDFEKAIKIIEKATDEIFSGVAASRLNTKDVIKLSGLDSSEIVRVKPFIEAGWKLSAALGFKAVTLSHAHTIRQLVDRCDAQGGRFSLEIGDHVIDVRRSSPERDDLNKFEESITSKVEIQ